MATLSKSLFVYDDGSVRLDAPRLLYSLPDTVARNAPATRKCQEDLFFPVSPELEAYIWGVDKLLNPDMPATRFQSFWESVYNGWKAFDNGNAWGSGHWKLENLYCAGATLKPVSETLDNGWIEVYAIDPLSPPPVPTSLSQIDMTLNFFPTVSVVTGNDPFPQFYGRLLQPFLGRGGRNWIRMGEYQGRGGMKWVSEIRNPFVPENTAITAGVIGG